MKQIKLINWKIVVYWFVVMCIMNVYIIPTYINHQPITEKRVLIGIIVSVIVSFLMGLLTIPKLDDNQK